MLFLKVGVHEKGNACVWGSPGLLATGTT